MTMSPLLTILDVAGIVLALIWIAKKLVDQREVRPLPPGPKPLPLIGNVLDMPTHNPWEMFSEWGQRYGLLTYLNLLGEHMIIINSHEVAVDLFEKRGALYSDRPVPPSAEITEYTKTLPLVPYGDRLREQRRMLNQVVGTRSLVETYGQLQEQEARQLLLSILRDPSSGDRLLDHVKTFTGALLLLLSYGYHINRNGEDHLLSAAYETVERFAQASLPGAFLVDVLPALRHVPSWFPGAGWKRRLYSNRDFMNDVKEEAYAFTKDQVTKGIATPSFMSRSLQTSLASETSAEKEDIVKRTALALLGGGIDTTTATLYAFFLAMTLYPDVQNKAQAELDVVVGRDRLPSFQDRDDLPYINAICLELLRWLPVGPLGVPHRLVEDDEYNGYHFPKGTVFIANLWGLLHDPERYSNPSEFSPERYMKTAEKEAEPDPHGIAFGYGRRSCPGLHIADASIFIVVASVLAAFTIEKKVEKGVPITPVAAQSSGILSHPLPFECSIKPRLANVEQLIYAGPENVIEY